MIEWIATINKKINNLQIQNIWKLIKFSSNVYIFNNKWIFKIKLNKNNLINKRKTRFVAKEFQQKYNINFLKTYNNTIKSIMYKMLFAFIIYNNYELKQWNIKLAFSNGKLKTNFRIYVKQSKNYEKSENLICLLKIALYNLKQIAKQFYLFLQNLLTNFDYKSIIDDIFVFFNKNTKIIVAAHIDNLLITNFNINKINKLQKQFQTKIEINDLNDVDFF